MIWRIVPTLGLSQSKKSVDIPDEMLLCCNKDEMLGLYSFVSIPLFPWFFFSELFDGGSADVRHEVLHRCTIDADG
jgi:hypothetical protein